MARKDDNLPFEDSAMQLDTNISRLVKLADDSNKPSSAFTRSLIDSALYELKRSDAQRKPQEKSIILKVSWWKKAMGWAAMFAAACGTGFAIILSTMLKINTFLSVIVILTMFANWLTYLGGLIL
jgi:hypothetical protein